MHVLQESIALQTAKNQSDTSAIEKSNVNSKIIKNDDTRRKRKQNERDTPKRKIDSKRRKLKKSMSLTEEGSKQLNTKLSVD